MRGGVDDYRIEKKINGRRFHFSTRCSTLRAALKQLERFEDDPLHYTPLGEPDHSGLTMSAELILEYFDYQTKVRQTTGHHARLCGRCLTRIAEQLGGKDLRTLTLKDDVKPALNNIPLGKHNIVALKGFMRWLRKEKHLLTSAQDCTIDLAVPQTTPEKWRRRKVATQEQVRAMAEHLPERYRDVLNLLCATGWHLTEMERFVRSSDSQLIVPPKKKGNPLAVLVVRHKTGDLTRTPISNPKQLESIKRLKAAKTVPRWIRRTFREACEKAGVEPINPGSMRHSVLTWAVEAGADPAKVAQFAGHKNVRTTMRFYVDVAVPTNAIPTMNI